MENKRKKNRRWINIFIALCFTLSIFGLYKYLQISFEKEQEAKDYNEIKEIFYEENNEEISNELIEIDEGTVIEDETDDDNIDNSNDDTFQDPGTEEEENASMNENITKIEGRKVLDKL